MIHSLDQSNSRKTQNTIDVLVLYTPEAAVRLGNNPATTIQEVINLQNQIFLNSGITGNVNLCGAELLSEFSEANFPLLTSTEVILEAITDSLTSDPFGVNSRRESFKADIVSIWVELQGENTIGSASWGLRKSIFDQGSEFASERAFLNVVIAAKASSPLFHFAHEFGHNLGFGHDIDASEQTQDLVFPYAHGYVDGNVPFRTVMAYRDACQQAGFENCSRIPFYSSADPTIQFNGRPVGIENLADNARVSKVTIPFVSSYRTQPIDPPTDAIDLPTLQACISLLLFQGDRPVNNTPATTAIRHYAGATQPGTTTYGAIELGTPAPPEGKVISFTSSDSALVKIPNVTVPAGKTTAIFPIHIDDNAANAIVTLTATSDFTKQTTLSIPAKTTQTLALGTKPGFNANVLGIATNGRYVYAAHYYSKAEDGHDSFGKGELVVIDSTTFNEVPNARIALGFQPRSVAVNPLTKRAYVTNYGQESYSLLVLDCTDTAKPKAMTEVRLGQVPIDVVVNTRTNRIYVTNPFQQKIHVISGATNTELQSIQLPSRPWGIAVDEQTNTLFVAMLDRNVDPIVNAIAVVKITGETGDQTQTEIEIIPIHADPKNPDPTRPTQPVDIAFNSTTNYLYVANLGGGQVHPSVSAIHLATREITTITTISGARAIAVNPRLNQVYIGTDTGIQIMDGATNTIVSTIPKHTPWGIALNPTTNQIYAGSATEGTIMQLAAPNLNSITRWTEALVMSHG